MTFRPLEQVIEDEIRIILKNIKHIERRLEEDFPMYAFEVHVGIASTGRKTYLIKAWHKRHACVEYDTPFQPELVSAEQLIRDSIEAGLAQIPYLVSTC